eukprot:1192094-Prorocentrum_minimum.AAC.6
MRCRGRGSVVMNRTLSFRSGGKGSHSDESRVSERLSAQCVCGAIIDPTCDMVSRAQAKNSVLFVDLKSTIQIDNKVRAHFARASSRAW